MPARPDLVIFEGWFLKVPPQAPGALRAPLNALERDEDPDGTWREPRGGAVIRGRWERTPDGKTCHWQVDPPVHNPTRYCYAPEKRAVGDRWTSTDPNTGNEVIQEIVPGREEPKDAP